MSTLSSVKRITSSQSFSFSPFQFSNLPYNPGCPINSSPIEIDNVGRFDSQTGASTFYLVSASVIDRSGTFGVYDLWFFNASPNYTGDNAHPFNVANLSGPFGAGIGSCVGVITIGQVYSTSGASNGISLDGGGIWKQMALNVNPTALFVVVVLRSIINDYLTQSDLTFRLDFLVE